jgi:hypothetical protein
MFWASHLSWAATKLAEAEMATATAVMKRILIRMVRILESLKMLGFTGV